MMLPLARILPGSGDTSVPGNGGEVTIQLDLPAGHPAFLDHFPGRPILAGVLQIDWAMRFAARYLALDQTVAEDFQVKFRRVIGPGEDLSLLLRLDRSLSLVVFEYRIAGEIASSGKIRLAPCP
jgi:3-hydroxymyristoyl/3-hydroxydecanoyl-(acyl carrier protein) dehydratase